MTVIIYPFDRIFTPSARTWSHVGKKVLERMPSYANFDSTAAVVFEFLYIWIAAPIHHLLPCRIFSRHLTVFGMAMGGPAPASGFSRQMTTRSRVAASKVGGSNDSLLTAVALAQPKNLAATAIASRFQYNKVAETLACDINHFGHGSLLSRLLLSSGGRALIAPGRCATV